MVATIVSRGWSKACGQGAEFGTASSAGRAMQLVAKGET